MNKPADHPLFREGAALLDRYAAILEEDQALRHAEYDRPDPRRRRLKVACNDCPQPWCCNQRVTVDDAEAAVIYRWAERHAPRALAAALRRADELRRADALRRPPEPLSDSAFFRRRVPCPFLVNGGCAIFAVRPYRCRSHYMAGNPMKCRDSLKPTETYEMSPDRALLAELDELAEELRFRGLLDGGDGEGELAEALRRLDERVRK